MRVAVVDPFQTNAAIVEEAAKELVSGGIVAFPTETVYGLGALATREDAIERVFAIKGRPSTHPLIAHVLDEEQAQALSGLWPKEAVLLARAFWPGPLTMVVPKAKHVSDLITGGLDSVAIRAPSHPLARSLIAAVSGAIVAPSANAYQTLSPTRAEHVLRSLGDADVLLLDGGPCSGGIESTVIDVTQSPPRVLRPGGISLDSLRAILPDIAFEIEVIHEPLQRPSPGMDARHYAPRLPLEIAASREQAIARARSLKAALITFGPCLEATHALSLDAKKAESELYAVLHEIDRSTATSIVIEASPSGSAWHAITDRLTRASHR